MEPIGVSARGIVRLLVCSAEATGTAACGGDDGQRGLSDLGLHQADRLILRLPGHSIRRVLSSPALRCRQTVAPLAAEAGLEVEVCRLLERDADPLALARYLNEAETDNAVLCTHLTAAGNHLPGRVQLPGPRRHRVLVLAGGHPAVERKS